MKTKKQLQIILEKKGFNCHFFTQGNAECAEIDTHTEGGVNMIYALIPFNCEEFIEYAQDFNIDEEIDIHRKMKGYKEAFTIRESLADFEKYSKLINRIAKQLTK